MFTSLLLSQLAFAAPKDYSVSISDSLLYVKVFKEETLASGLAHNHAIQATNWTGAVKWDKENVADCKLSFSVPVKDLAVDKPAIRKKAGLVSEVSESQREEIFGNMTVKKQLGMASYPTISFESTTCVE